MRLTNLGSVGDTFNATENPYGSILNAVQAGSGWMEGTTGTLGTGAVAVAAWSARAFALGEPCITAGGNLYVAVVAGTASASPVHTSGNAADGTVVWRFVAGGAVAGLATGWTCARQTGDGTAAVCKIARTDGVPGEWQVVMGYGATSTTGHRLITASSATGFAVGGQYVLDAEFVHHSSTNLNCIGGQIIVDGTSGSKQAQWGLSSTSSTYYHRDNTADPALPLVMETPPKWLTVSASTALRVGLHVGHRASGAVVAFFGRTRLRRVA